MAVRAEIIYQNNTIETLSFESVPRVGEYLEGLDANGSTYIVEQVSHVWFAEETEIQVHLFVTDATPPQRAR